MIDLDEKMLTYIGADRGITYNQVRLTRISNPLYSVRQIGSLLLRHFNCLRDAQLLAERGVLSVAESATRELYFEACTNRTALWSSAECMRREFDLDDEAQAALPHLEFSCAGEMVSRAYWSMFIYLWSSGQWELIVVRPGEIARTGNAPPYLSLEKVLSQSNTGGTTASHDMLRPVRRALSLG